MHHAPGEYSQYATGAVRIQNMLLDHAGLRILLHVIHMHAPGAATP